MVRGIHYFSAEVKKNLMSFQGAALNNANVNTYELPGYQHEFDYRKNKIGGGVSIFTKHNVEYRTRTDLNISNKFIESLFIEIPKSTIVRSKNDVVGVVYRPLDTDNNVFTMYIKKNTINALFCNEVVYPTDHDFIFLRDFFIKKNIFCSHFYESDCNPNTRFVNTC